MQLPFRIGSRVLALGWFVLMCILFFMPAQEVPHAGWTKLIHADKIVHVSLFLIMMFLWKAAFPRLMRYFVVAATLLMLYGISVEYIQLWFTNRSFEWLDVVADTTGAIIGWFAFGVWYKKNKPL